MAITLLPVPTNAATKYQGSDPCNWTIDDQGTLTFESNVSYGSEDGIEIGGITQSFGGTWQNYKAEVKKVVFPKGPVRSDSGSDVSWENAFKGFTNLEKVENLSCTGNQVGSIFDGCNKLSSITTTDSFGGCQVPVAMKMDGSKNVGTTLPSGKHTFVIQKTEPYAWFFDSTSKVLTFGANIYPEDGSDPYILIDKASPAFTGDWQKYASQVETVVFPKGKIVGKGNTPVDFTNSFRGFTNLKRIVNLSMSGTYDAFPDCNALSEVTTSSAYTGGIKNPVDMRMETEALVSKGSKFPAGAHTFKPKTFNVATFDGNGAQTTYDGQTYVPYKSYIEQSAGINLGTLPSIFQLNYSFDGWYTQKTGGTKITSKTPMPDKDVTYYAHWTPFKGQQTIIENQTDIEKAKITVHKEVSKKDYELMKKRGVLTEWGNIIFRLKGKTEDGQEVNQTKVLNLQDIKLVSDDPIVEVVFDNLEMGTYTVTEDESEDMLLKSVTKKSGPGKVKTQDDGRPYFEVTFNKDNYKQKSAFACEVAFHNRNSHTGSLKVIKYGDVGETKPLKGVHFRLTNKDDPKDVIDLVTDKNGECKFDDIFLGDYELRETKTVEGYQLLKDPIDVTIPYTISKEDAEKQNVNTAEAYLTSNGTYMFYNLTYTITNQPNFEMPMTGQKTDMRLILLLIVAFSVIAVGYSYGEKKREQKKGAIN